jgi:hypothetical protein
MIGELRNGAIKISFFGCEDYFAYYYAYAAATSYDEAASGKLLHARMTPHP